MATKVQSKNYLPGYYSMQDIKEDATSTWSSFYQDKKLSEHIYDTYVPRLVNGYSEHDKEMLKQTMLKHEAIFRKQVYELHRLYRIQKDLMDEFQSRGFLRCPIPAEASHSNSFSSQRQSEHTEKISQASSCYRGGNASYRKIPFAVTERPQFNFKREHKVTSDQLSFMNGTYQKDTEEVNDIPHKKRTFDLQLPADVYIDVEDTDGSWQMNAAEKNGTCSLYSGKDMRLGLGNGHTVDQDISNSATLMNRSACDMVDLNEPTAEISSESPATSASDQLHSWKTYSEHNHGHHSSMRSNANFMVRHRDQQFPPDLVRKDAPTKGGWPLFNHESGNNRIILDKFPQNLYKNNLPTPSETVLLNAKKSCENFPFNRNIPDASSRQEPTQEIKTSLRFPHLTCSNSSLVSPSVPSAIITPQTDAASCASSFVSSWRRPSSCKDNLPVAAQALPCFSSASNLTNGSLSSKMDAQGPITNCQKWRSSRDTGTTILGIDIMASRVNAFHDGHLDSDSTKIPKAVSCKADRTDDYKADLPGHPPGSNHVKYFQSRDLKPPLYLNLNQAFASGMEHRLASRQDLLYCDVYDKALCGPSWLKKASTGESVDAKKTSRLGFSFFNGHPQHVLKSDVVACDIERKEEKDLELPICNQQKVASSLQFKYQKLQANEVFDYGKRTICVPTHENNKQGNISDSNGSMKNPSTDSTEFMKNDKIFSDYSCDKEMLNSQKSIQIDDGIGEKSGVKSSADFRSHINLNAEFPYVDDPTSSEMAVPQVEVVVQPSSKSISIFGAKIASDTDQEGPKLDLANQHKCNQLRKEDDSDEKEYFINTLVRLAADSLVSISMRSNDHSDESGPCSLSLPQFTTLCWFADVVTSSAEDPKTAGSGGDGNTDGDHDDGLDLFEAMTLKLEETKEDQYWCTPKQADNKDDNDEKEGKEVAGSASLLFTKPRRGQARKRRQRRDFQKDILPGLASLSRYEVSEDLQTIGGMMKASGRHWHAGLARRNAGRNGANSQTKGRRQPRSLAITVEEEEVEVNPPHEPSHHSNPEIGCARGSNMIGWGRTTRRCRRQRCLPGNLPAPLA